MTSWDIPPPPPPPPHTHTQEGVTGLQSRKFLPLMYQLAARMSTRSADPFQQILQSIILRSTLDHPHHSLYVILALSNASKDNLFPVAGHVTGTRMSKASGRLQRKNSSGVGNAVDEVSEVWLERGRVHYLKGSEV